MRPPVLSDILIEQPLKFFYIIASHQATLSLRWNLSQQKKKYIEHLAIKRPADWHCFITPTQYSQDYTHVAIFSHQIHFALLCYDGILTI